MAKRYDFQPKRVTVDIGDDGIALLVFSTAREDIALFLDSDTVLRLQEKIEHAQAEKAERVANASKRKGR
jgi:hypothetical protein